MIEAVLLEDFISHNNTTLRLDNGLTLFIGHNGAGKSSIIDAITFGLYGQHTRRNNKNLVKRGANSSLVQIEMSVRGRRLKVVRGVNASGQLINAKLTEQKPSGPIVLVSGERKQFAESVAEEVSKILGLDYSKLKVAAVVQQGELNAIIQAQPREFKELINSLFGLDRLDSAYQSMKELLQHFRAELRKKTGYDDSDITMVEEKLLDARKISKEAQKILNELEEERKYLRNKIAELEGAIKEQEPLQLKINELENTEASLLNYIKSEKKKIEQEISRDTELINHAKKYLLIMKDKDKIESKLAELQKSLLVLDSELEIMSNDIGRLEALMEVGSKLQLVDGKCPVCNSPVSKIDEIYDTDHLKRELIKRKGERKKLTDEKEVLKSTEREYRNKELETSNAESFLFDNKINGMNDIEVLQKEILQKKNIFASIPANLNHIDDIEQLIVDDFAKSLGSKILNLRKETQSFDNNEYESLKGEYKKLSAKQLELESRVGEFKTKFKQAEDECSKLEVAIKELEKADEYIQIFERIRSSVYNRDGVVGMSLRTWALKTISQKASEYTSMFNMSISRLQLTEKARDISIECYGRSGAIDMESLSGGEKVAIALALRLGMAYVMGSGKLDFVILDEPTTHLDEDRRKSLVRIITEAFRSGLGPLSQMILITHDSEIFENAEVDSIYRFSMTNEGTKVTKL